MKTNKPIQKSAIRKYQFIVQIVLIVTGFLNEAMFFSLFNATQILSIGWAYHGLESIFSEIFDLNLNSPETGTFPIPLEKAHKSAHRLQQGYLRLVSTFVGTNYLKGIGCNQIIVLIVLIVTQCLNEAMPFSLFNAMQILSIPVRENPAVVFIVTGSPNEAMSFSLLMRRKFWA